MSTDRRTEFPNKSLTRDYFGRLRFWAWFLVVGGIVGLLLAAGLCVGFWIDSSACEQRATSRPDIPVEWHWNTGCILLNPEQSVVISS